ncbi:MAG: hypothetical protein IPN02_16440 [Candidatus Microthrix sp.]|uniref:Uncharacterized protein n=1 Tax=Candidatus Neomicrothrix subdominans TaxID=2954438 RepID=A0A936NG94_9ACTN|nr:hypothetical protein [Candidatus Microthrix subdominans]
MLGIGIGGRRRRLHLSRHGAKELAAFFKFTGAALIVIAAGVFRSRVH